MFTNVHTGKTYEIQSWTPANPGLYAERTSGKENETRFYILIVGWAHLEVITGVSEDNEEEIWPVTIKDAVKSPSEWRPIKSMTTNPNREMEIVR